MASLVALGVTRLGAVTGNTGYFGVPVVLALLHRPELAFAVIYDIVGSLITWTVGPPLISGARISGRSLAGHLARSPRCKAWLWLCCCNSRPWHR